jgi:hypothetical protein
MMWKRIYKAAGKIADAIPRCGSVTIRAWNSRLFLPTVRTAILLNAPLVLTRLTAIVVTVAVLESHTKGYALAAAADK